MGFTRAVALACWALAVMPCLAQAQEQVHQSGPYIGFSLGQSKATLSDSFGSVNSLIGPNNGSISKDETDNAWKLLAGWRLHRFFAIEGAYADYGKFSATNTVTFPVNGSFTQKIGVTGWSLQGVGIIPIGNFSLFGKAGAAYATAKGDKAGSGGVTIPPFFKTTSEKSAITFVGGPGAGYEFNKNFGMRLEAERLWKVGDGTTGEASVLLISLGGLYKF